MESKIEVMIEQVAELQDIMIEIKRELDEIKKSNDRLVEFAETNEHLTEMMIES